MNLVQISSFDHVRQRFEGIEIHDSWGFHCCVYGQAEEKEEPNQMRPDIKRFIMNGEDAEEHLLQWPLRSVITQNKLIVP